MKSGFANHIAAQAMMATDIASLGTYSTLLINIEQRKSKSHGEDTLLAAAGS